MKRSLGMILLLLFVLFSIHCWTQLEEPSTFTVSAYKDGPAPYSYVKVMSAASSSDEITGTDGDFDITAQVVLSGNGSFQNALVVEIGSNIKDRISVTVTFTPFVNQTDNTDIVTATYARSITNGQAVETTYLGNTYTFSPVLAVTPAGNFVANSENPSVIATLTYSISTKKNGSGSTMPSSSGSTIPGIGNNMLVSRCSFSLSGLGKDNFTKKVKYTSYITVEVTGN